MKIFFSSLEKFEPPEEFSIDDSMTRITVGSYHGEKHRCAEWSRIFVPTRSDEEKNYKVYMIKRTNHEVNQVRFDFISLQSECSIGLNASIVNWSARAAVGAALQLIDPLAGYNLFRRTNRYSVEGNHSSLSIMLPIIDAVTPLVAIDTRNCKIKDLNVDHYDLLEEVFVKNKMFSEYCDIKLKLIVKHFDRLRSISEIDLAGSSLVIQSIIERLLFDTTLKRRAIHNASCRSNIRCQQS